MEDHPELTNFIKSMHKKGILDENFDAMKDKQTVEDPRYVRDMIDVYCKDSATFIQELTNLLEPAINYSEVSASADRLKKCSSEVGGCRVVLGSTTLVKASEANDKERCIVAIEKIKEEHNILQEALVRIYELEEKKQL